jgi:dihydrofolate reductase
MGKVTANISVSLDGFIAGPGDDVDRLHQWLYDLASWREPHGLEGGERNRDAEILEEGFKATGAILIGRRMFDLAEGPWGDTPPFHMPVFVLTHRPREQLVKQGGTTFTFVTDGIESALQQAKAAAGDKDVGVGGGANVIQQYLKARLLDEIQLHLIPVLLGSGIRLFDHLGSAPPELESTEVVASPRVTHLSFRVVR